MANHTDVWITNIAQCVPETNVLDDGEVLLCRCVHNIQDLLIIRSQIAGFLEI